MFLLRILAWPFRLIGHAFLGAGRAARAAKGKTAPAVGAVALIHGPAPVVDVYRTVFFHRIICPPSDEPDLGPNDIELAGKMGDRARSFFTMRPDLFPPDNIFYEDVEGGYLGQVCRIDNGGVDDQFVHTLGQARRITNDNTRTLFCEIAPAVLLAVLIAVGLLLIRDPLHLVPAGGAAWTPASYSQPQALLNLAVAGAAALAGAFLMLLVHRFSYTHVQRENCLSLDNYITTNFARLNNQFRVAQRESLQAETQLSDAEREELKRRASAWALAFHWIGVRQLTEEMIVRNAMFQIRRNTALYVTLGVVLCILGLVLVLGGLEILAGALGGAGVRSSLLLHLPAITLAYLVLVYGLALRNSFAIVAASLRKDQWNRIDTLDVGEAISEQISRDKIQIVINRDRLRAGAM
jgi:hypothetical protein